jgi:CubicO group peptidase (beta-lactamase class C family)
MAFFPTMEHPMQRARPALLVLAVLAGPARADTAIPVLLEQAAIPGVSLAHIVGGKIVHVAAYGVQKDGVPATPKTLYNIASLTKPIAAEVILRQASAGKLGLDEPVFSAWTDPDLANDARHEKLTVRLLLSHQSGFPNWRAKSGLAFERDPGTAVGYSGEGYQYAANFTQAKAGKPFETLAQEALFKPAHLSETAFTGRPWFAARVAVPHDGKGKALEPVIATRFNAADLVYTTAADYAAFMLEVMDDKGLSPAMAAERGRIQVDNRASYCKSDKQKAVCPAALGFGLGWEVLQFKDEKILMHTGKDDGVFTFAYINKTSREGAVIMTNSDHGWKAVMPVLENLKASPAYLAFLRSQI